MAFQSNGRKVLVPTSRAAAAARREEEAEGENSATTPVRTQNGKVLVSPSGGAAAARREEEAEGETEPTTRTKKKGRMPPPGASTPAWKKIAAAMAAQKK